MDATISARDPRAEAQALVGDEHRARVLEPSPPAVTEGPFFADDPVALDDAGGSVVTMRGLPGSLDWDAWLAVDGPADDQRRAWVTSSWLGADRRLPRAPADLTATRIDLHRLAAYVIAPVRHRANGKFGLRWTRGGFGTPFFPGPDGEDRQIRVEGTTLVDQRGGSVADGGTVRTAPITTLRAAAEFLGGEIDTETAAEHDSPPVGDIDAPLVVDPAASVFLGHWFGLGFAALEAVRGDAGSADPSRPQLWPGHFDPAIEVGDEDHRGSYGASPGDAGVDEPYLYLSVWWPDRVGLAGDDLDRDLWNAPSFTGAVLRLSDFPADEDPVDVATRFWFEHRDALHRG
ncbi:MAG: hypothetical protein AAGA93_26420 [Actinomycetota bacterium]